MGSVISAPIVQKETLWIGVFRRYVMKKRCLNLALKDGQVEKNHVLFHQRGW